MGASSRLQKSSRGACRLKVDQRRYCRGSDGRYGWKEFFDLHTTRCSVCLIPSSTATKRQHRTPSTQDRRKWVTAKTADATEQAIFRDAWGNHQICVVGTVRYKDGNGVARDTAFFRVLDDDGESFVLSPHDAEM